MNADEAEALRKSRNPIEVRDLATAEDWTNIHHRMLCHDAKSLARAEARLRNLERPWWKRLLGVGQERLPE